MGCSHARNACIDVKLASRDEARSHSRKVPWDLPSWKDGRDGGSISRLGLGALQTPFVWFL